MMITRLAAVAMLAAAAPARAGSVTLTHPGGALLVHLADDGGELAKLVGAKHGSVVRCYGKDDGVVGYNDEPLTGCFVEIRRDGKLVAPPADLHFRFPHLTPPLEGTFQVEPAAGQNKPGPLQVTITGAVGNAIGLWVDCADRRGDLRCQPNSGMAGKFGWDVTFVVTKGGAVGRVKA